MADSDAVSVIPDAHLDQLLKRKLDDMETPDAAAPPRSTAEIDGSELSENLDAANGDQEPSKRPRLDEQPDSLASENGHKAEEVNGTAVADAETEVAVEVTTETAVVDQVDGDEVVPEEVNEVQAEKAVVEGEPEVDAEEGGDSEGKDVEKPAVENVENVENTATEGAEQVDGGSEQQYTDSGNKGTTRRIEIPNNKVGVLIGKSGDTIKYLQLNSGAKIQITRDAEADPRAATRPVELVGTLESLNKAESLIKDVIAEADAGGSPSLVARGFTAAITAGSLEIEIPVPGDKVGLIIGRGGETIRNLQTRSGARIQLIPQNLPGDQSKEKKVKVTGDKKQVEIAKELIKEVMNQMPGRPSQFSGNNYSQQGYRPRVPGGGPQWGARGPHGGQSMQYDYHQRGPYPSQNQQYPPQSYGNYPPQGPPRSGFGSWEQRPPAQGPPPHSGGYDYYGQGGHANAPASTPHSAHMPGHHASGPSMAPPPHSQAHYNYPQPRGADYAHPTPYSQTPPPAQSYGHGYGEPKYDAQAPLQQQQPPYAGQGYAQQQQGYAPQQQYNRPPPYGMPSQGAPPQNYAPPAASQPAADTPYQAPAPAAQPYGQNMPPQQQYPQAPYGTAPVANDGYSQPQPAAAGYPQQAAQPVPAYGQQATGYAQTAGSTPGYGQYPSTAQASYNDQAAAAAAAAASAAAYGYQGQVDPSAYAAAAGQQQAYGAAPAVAQQGYAQPAPAQTGYDQSAVAPQSGGYATAPAGAPGAYGKTLSPQPQPGYPQYDASQQVYTTPR